MRLSPINLKILAYTLEVEGFDAREALSQCGLGAMDDIPEDGDWVPVEVFDRMMAAALQSTGDPAFGLVAGKSLALMKYGVITPVVLSTPTLRQMLSDIRRFAVLMVERSEVELVEQEEVAQLVVQPVVHGGVSGRFRTEQVATSAVQMLRFAGAGADDIHHVAFPYGIPEGLAQRYAAAFGPRIHFERGECAITFNPALLDQTLPAHDPVAYASARTRADAVLSAMRARSDTAEAARQCLLQAFPRQPTAGETAASLGITERSYRRRLAMLDTSHTELAQECQRLMAERLLAEGRPLKQIAEALGFSSVHSFHRAFRRWSGSTPSHWRGQQVDRAGA